MSAMLQDLRYAARTLWRSPGFTFTAVVTLALGIGVNVAVFTVTNAALFRGFRQVEGNERILYLDTRERGQGCCVSYPDFEDWRAQAKSFDGMGAVADLRITLNDDSGSPEAYSATLISAGSFPLLGRQPLLGRAFSESDEAPGAPPVAILTHRFWERRYGADPAILGRTVRINGTPTDIIGVMPKGFSFPQSQDLWLPLTPTPNVQRREARGLWFAFGRLSPSATIESARAEMETIGRQMASAYPQTNQGLFPAVHTFSEFFIGPNAATIYWAMLGAVGFVLLIACANLANLLLARAVGRSREISVRIALGAGRGRIIRQLLVESLLLSALGGACGWWVAHLSLQAYQLAASPPAWFGDTLDYSMDFGILAYLVAISIGTGLLFGLAPAARLFKLDVNARLKDGGRGSTGGGGGKRLSSALVTVEMALAVILLAGAGVMIRSFLNIYNADLGVRADNILTAFLRLPDTGYPGASAQASFFDRLVKGLESSPGVESVAMADTLPAGGARRLPYELAGAAPVEEQLRPKVSVVVISPAYFQTLGAGVVSGREFRAADGVSGPPVAIVNQQFASQHWPSQDPLGQRLRLFDANEWLTIVGVASNIVQSDSTRQMFDPVVYLPFEQSPVKTMWVMARSSGPAGALGPAFRREVQALDANLPIWLGPYLLSERLAGDYRSSAFSGGLFVAFAALALLLASVGLYAVIAHSVSRSTQEVGVRLALGGTPRDILKWVFAQGMRPLAVGLGIGLSGSLFLNRLLEAELVQVSPSDPLTLFVVCAVLFASAALGCWIPARRATRVDPVIALRHE